MREYIRQCVLHPGGEPHQHGLVEWGMKGFGAVLGAMQAQRCMPGNRLDELLPVVQFVLLPWDRLKDLKWDRVGQIRGQGGVELGLQGQAVGDEPLALSQCAPFSYRKIIHHTSPQFASLSTCLPFFENCEAPINS